MTRTNATILKIGLGVVESIGLSITFWRKNSEVYRAEYPREIESSGAGTRQALKSKVTWIAALFFFTLGVEGELRYLALETPT